MLLLQGRISSPQNMTLCVIGRVRFERNCGKMYSRHLFPYGGLTNKSAQIPPQIRYLVDRNLRSSITLAFHQSDGYLLYILFIRLRQMPVTSSR